MFKSKVLKNAGEVVAASEKLLKDVMNFVEKKIVKIDVKVQEGPLLKESRMILAQGLRNLAKAIEQPGSKIKWVDIKKKPVKKTTKKAAKRKKTRK